MTHLFNETSANTNAITAIDDVELGELRQRFCNATKSDRKRVKKMLNEVMLDARELSNNATCVGTRVPRDVVSRLNDASATYDTTVAALLRDAVIHYIQHELPKRKAPDADEISICE